MMEYWKVEDPVFSGIGFYKEGSHLWILFTSLSRGVLSIFHYAIFPKSIIPSFHYSNPALAGWANRNNLRVSIDDWLLLRSSWSLTRINRKSAYLSRSQRGSELKFEVPIYPACSGEVKESLRSVYSYKVDRISQIRNSISKSLNLLILKQDTPEPNRL